MKLYIWEHLQNNAFYGLAVAVATSVEEAKTQILQDANPSSKWLIEEQLNNSIPDIYDLPHGTFWSYVDD